MSATTAGGGSTTAQEHRSIPVIGKLESPLTTYYLILGVTATLVVFGLVMVFSASSVEALLADEAAYSVFLRQLIFAVIGAVAAGGVSRLEVRWLKRLAVPIILGSVLLLAAVIPLGRTVNGNRNWLAIGPVQFQPSEFAKLGLVLVGALVFSNKSSRMTRLVDVAVPYLMPISLVVIGLILAGKDLGTALIVLVIIGSVLFVAGTPKRVFALAGALAAVGVAFMVTGSGNRTSRIANWLSPACQSDPDGWCGQSVHGMYALADGGWWGVGLGASKEKWEWLSEAHNDFIFAIIGEELGLPGTLAVVALYVALGYACYRLIVTSRDFFVRLATAGIMAWILVQAMINIGSVTGLLPIIGVPLPLVSSGGSALVTTLLALGILISFARNEPTCKVALAARPNAVKRTLAVLPLGRR